MGDVVMDFDDEPDETTDVNNVLTLKSRAESIVRLPTKSKGLGIISRSELAPGIYLAETLTEGVDGYCVTSIVNTSEDVPIDLPLFELEEIENYDSERALIFSTSVAEIGNRLSKLRDELRTEHLNSEERISLVKICEEYNDVFYLPGDKLTFTTAAEHAIPTPAVEHKGIGLQRNKNCDLHELKEHNLKLYLLYYL